VFVLLASARSSNILNFGTAMIAGATFAWILILTIAWVANRRERPLTPNELAFAEERYDRLRARKRWFGAWFVRDELEGLVDLRALRYRIRSTRDPTYAMRNAHRVALWVCLPLLVGGVVITIVSFFVT
jgi:hypothetical protein